MDIYDIRNALSSGKTIYDLPLRVTSYARVSTDKDEQLHSLSAQIRYYNEFIRRNPQWIFVEGYIDEGISGTTVVKRENFQRMIQDAQLGHFDFIVTKEISRFSRSTLDSIKYTQELLQCGVGVLFESDNINTLMPDAELRLTIMSSIAQDEVRKTSERVKFGFKRAIENGVVLGNDRIWGYEKEKGKLVVKEEEAKIVRMIFDLYANERMGIRTIANYLSSHGYKNTKGNNFSFSTIRGILCNPKYKGYYCGRKSSKIDYKLKTVKHFPEDEWVMYKDEENVPPIVSEELWDKANLILSKRSAKQSAEDKSGYQNRYPYSGKIICGVQIIHELGRIYQSIGNGSKTEEDIARSRVEIDSILKRKDKLLDLSIDGRISDEEFSQRNSRFNAEIEKLRARLAELEEEKQKNQEMLQSIDVLRQAITRELSFENGFSVGVVDALLDRMEVHPQKEGEKDVIHVSVYLKAIPEEEKFCIQRKRGSTSVCFRQYT